MHELGIVFYIIRNINKVAQENNIKKIKKVTLEIGEVSSVIPEYLMDCYKWAIQKEDILRESDLVIEIVEAINHCDECNMDFKATVFGRECPNCHSENTHLLTGNETNIKSIEY